MAEAGLRKLPSRKAPGRRPALGNRLSQLLLGNPDPRLALGIMPSDACGKPAVVRRLRLGACTTDAYYLERRRADGLGRIWVSEPAERPSRTDARRYVACYPGAYDPHGLRAQDLADGCYGEGLSLSGPNSDSLRAQCFRAAEVLYLHAAAKGNAHAYERLGIIYENDLGQGFYESLDKPLPSPTLLSAYLKSRAQECYAMAASMGRSDAWWRLADLVQGSHAMAQRIDLLLHALKAGANDPACRGMAALRLAKCRLHEGGPENRFSDALQWYSLAEQSLDEAFGSGSWRCKRALGEARKGVRRMEQELSGCH